MTELKTVLAAHIPEKALHLVEMLFITNDVQLKVSRNRKTKLGDYRPPQRNFTYHRISVNYNLNQYEFLVTLIHEFAHLFVWNKHRNRVDPHGTEFKTTYYSLLNQFIDQNVFPDDIKTALLKIEVKPETAKLELGRILKSYNSTVHDTQFIEQIPMHTLFKTADGRTFQKIEKLRKRYKCLCLNDKRKYLFHPLVNVVSVD
ncbi:MAG: SprT-like domain-containing protein [Bacteroidetes bacterium]|nr:SprT-like domain-containing protein [Bacteroidota bacterium]